MHSPFIRRAAMVGTLLLVALAPGAVVIGVETDAEAALRAEQLEDHYAIEHRAEMLETVALDYVWDGRLASSIPREYIWDRRLAASIAPDYVWDGRLAG